MNNSVSTFNQYVPQSVIKKYKKTVKKWGEKNLERDSKIIINYKKLENEVMKINESIIKDNNYFKNDVCNQLDMLEKNMFVEKDINITLTTKGIISSIIQEMPCLSISEYILENIDTITSLSPTEISVLLSIFTNIRVSDENKVYNHETLNIPYSCKKEIDSIKTYINKYLDIEVFYCSCLAKNYEIQFNVCEIVYKWCNASNENECSKIFQELEYWGIFLGDFVKAILKINNMVNELEKVAELTENVKLLSLLQQIPKLTLKSVVTNNSLYL